MFSNTAGSSNPTFLGKSSSISSPPLIAPQVHTTGGQGWVEVGWLGLGLERVGLDWFGLSRPAAVILPKDRSPSEAKGPRPTLAYSSCSSSSRVSQSWA